MIEDNVEFCFLYLSLSLVWNYDERIKVMVVASINNFSSVKILIIKLHICTVTHSGFFLEHLVPTRPLFWISKKKLSLILFLLQFPQSTIWQILVLWYCDNRLRFQKFFSVSNVFRNDIILSISCIKIKLQNNLIIRKMLNQHSTVLWKGSWSLV